MRKHFTLEKTINVFIIMKHYYFYDSNYDFILY